MRILFLLFVASLLAGCDSWINVRGRVGAMPEAMNPTDCALVMQSEEDEELWRIPLRSADISESIPVAPGGTDDTYLFFAECPGLRSARVKVRGAPRLEPVNIGELTLEPQR